MRPLAVLNAIVFGSAAAITFGLLGVVVIFLVLASQHPELGREFPTLLGNGALFAALTAVSGVSLFGMLKGLRWRWIAQMAMWFTTAGLILFYWPR